MYNDKRNDVFIVMPEPRISVGFWRTKGVTVANEIGQRKLKLY